MPSPVFLWIKGTASMRRRFFYDLGAAEYEGGAGKWTWKHKSVRLFMRH